MGWMDALPVAIVTAIMFSGDILVDEYYGFVFCNLVDHMNSFLYQLNGAFTTLL